MNVHLKLYWEIGNCGKVMQFWCSHIINKGLIFIKAWKTSWNIFVLNISCNYFYTSKIKSTLKILGFSSTSDCFCSKITWIRISYKIHLKIFFLLLLKGESKIWKYFSGCFEQKRKIIQHLAWKLKTNGKTWKLISVWKSEGCKQQH